MGVDPRPSACRRGAGVGEALLARLGEIATERGWRCARWITADDNCRARTLYDRVAEKTGWNMYEMGVGRLARADGSRPLNGSLLEAKRIHREQI